MILLIFASLAALVVSISFMLGWESHKEWERIRTQQKEGK